LANRDDSPARRAALQELIDETKQPRPWLWLSLLELIASGGRRAAEATGLARRVLRCMPVDGAAKYGIRGRTPNPRLTENYFTLWTDKMATVDVLDGKSLHVDSQGRFEIPVYSDEKGDRPDHVRSSPAAKEFYIRDVMLDCDEDTVLFKVRREGDGNVCHLNRVSCFVPLRLVTPELPAEGVIGDGGGR
jgi:hypothetical protein